MRAVPAVIISLTLAVMFAAAAMLLSQDKNRSYPRLAPVEQYLMDQKAEISLARSAAPDSVSREAKILVLGPHGYQTAAEGKNGFVCVVVRSWMLPFDNPEFWNPKVRLPLCMNPPGARLNLPLTFMTTEMALAGLPKSQISTRIKSAYENKELPQPESGAMCYMMSKQQYFGDKEGNAGDSHLMFWFPQGGQVDWGAEGSDSPVDVHQYSPQPITEFTISVSHWSDGTVVVTDQN